MDSSKYFVSENFCDDCDNTVHAIFNIDDFNNHKVGRIRCKCGCVVEPCNECESRDDCGDCPYKNAEIVDEMSDESYMRWLKDNEPKTYEVFKSGDNGDYYSDIIRKIEEESAENGDEDELQKVNSVAYTLADYGIWGAGGDEDYEQKKWGATCVDGALLLMKAYKLESVKWFNNSRGTIQRLTRSFLEEQRNKLIKEAIELK